ncbi:MAG: hypothetical protein ABI242_10790 [Caulobacteraceae bacterium]
MPKAATLAAACLACATLTAGAALAQGGRITDGQYFAAARCEGLMASASLGRQDVSGIKAMLDAQGAGRMPDVTERADEARRTAVRQAGHAGPEQKASLVAERDGACRAFAGGSATAAIDRPSTTN